MMIIMSTASAHWCTWNVYFASNAKHSFLYKWRHVLGGHRYII